MCRNAIAVHKFVLNMVEQLLWSNNVFIMAVNGNNRIVRLIFISSSAIASNSIGIFNVFLYLVNCHATYLFEWEVREANGERERAGEWERALERLISRDHGVNERFIWIIWWWAALSLHCYMFTECIGNQTMPLIIMAVIVFVVGVIVAAHIKQFCASAHYHSAQRNCMLNA